MKKVFFILAAVFTMVACNLKVKKGVETIAESLTDSIFDIDGDTLGNLESFTYEGVIPHEGDNGTEYQLILQEVTPDSIGTYTLSSIPVNPKTGKSDAVRDSGLVITVIGLPEDSVAVIYQLISADVMNKKKNVIVHDDSTLVMAHDLNNINKNNSTMLKKVNK